MWGHNWGSNFFLKDNREKILLESYQKPIGRKAVTCVEVFSVGVYSILFKSLSLGIRLDYNVESGNFYIGKK